MQSTIVVREDGCVEIPAELLPSITLDESFGTAWTVLATEDAYTLLGVDGVSDFLLGLIAHDEAYVHMSEAAGEWHDYMLFRNGKAIMAMSFAVETHHADGTIEKHDERGYQIALVDEF